MKRARTVEVPREAAWMRAVRRDAVARRIVQAWRRLTTADRARRAGAGEGTLVACSGGADSSALVLVLAAAVGGARGKAERPRIVVAHVVHDLRPRREAEADRDATRRLAELVGAEFVEARIRVRAKGGNLEGGARKARYAALLRLAKREGLRFVATAHHADDQLETVLMALMRGSGPRGLAGVAVSRSLEDARGGVRLVRPMVEAAVNRADSERICSLVGWDWVVDATNADESRLRSAVRHQIVPRMKALRAGVAERAAASAKTLRYAAAVTRRRGEAIWKKGRDHNGAKVWPRRLLRGQPEVLLGELVRVASRELGGAGAQDKLGSRGIAPIVRAVRDDSTEPRRIEVGGIRVDVTARTVTIAGRSSR